MIKHLLLTGAFALTIFSTSFAQSIRWTAHSFYNPGINQGLGGDATIYSFSQTPGGDTIQAAVAKGVSSNLYAPIVIPVVDPNNSFADTLYNSYDPSHLSSKNIVIRIKADASISIGIALQDTAGYVTDAPSLSATLTANVWMTVTTSVPTDKYQQIYSGTNKTTAAACTSSAPCLVDSNAIGFLQITPAPNAVFNGNIWIDYVYLGDSTIDNPLTAAAAPTSSAPAAYVYPNPVSSNSGLVTINDNGAPSYSITLTNTLGAVVGTSTGTTINSPAASGMYFVTYTADGTMPKTLPLMVK